MFQVCTRIKQCRLALLQLKRHHQLNSGRAIQDIKNQMVQLQDLGGFRNWTEWSQLQAKLGDAYRQEEVFWQQKSRLGTTTQNFFMHIPCKGGKRTALSD